LKTAISVQHVWFQWVFESSWLHKYVFIKTLSHDTKSKGLAKSKRLCLDLTGCILTTFCF